MSRRTRVNALLASIAIPALLLVAPGPGAANNDPPPSGEEQRTESFYWVGGLPDVPVSPPYQAQFQLSVVTSIYVFPPPRGGGSQSADCLISANLYNDGPDTVPPLDYEIAAVSPYFDDIVLAEAETPTMQAGQNETFQTVANWDQMLDLAGGSYFWYMASWRVTVQGVGAVHVPMVNALGYCF